MVKKKLIFVIISPIIFIALIFAIYEVLPLQIKYHSKINVGTKIVKELDDYYIANKRYPDETDFVIIENIYRKIFLKENIEFDESTQPYYFNEKDGYILIYFFGFDEELYYYSPIKEWQFGHSSRVLYNNK